MKLNEKVVTKIKTCILQGDKQEDIAAVFGCSRSIVSDIATGRAWKHVPWSGVPKSKLPALTPEFVLHTLKRSQPTTAQIAKLTGKKLAEVKSLLADMQAEGCLVSEYGGRWHLAKTPPASTERHVYTSRPDGTYCFGFLGDTHLCSKYERLDVLQDLYAKFTAAGVDRVFHAGNWIDGEARFNMHDLHTHGMDQQIEYLVKHYPTGPTTYAVAGDDHEGWYGQRDGIDIGRHAERIMRENGREDWKHLGYMEAFITLQRARTGASSQLLVMHPGGGSAYAHSYKPQKIVEGFTGGEKPAVLLIGHYHKISQNVIRNVWAIQCGTTQDQTPFMRKRGIDAHVGGGICRLTQDTKGAIVGCNVEFFLYYNRGYYNNRWSHGGSVSLPDRGVK